MHGVAEKGLRYLSGRPSADRFHTLRYKLGAVLVLFARISFNTGVSGRCDVRVQNSARGLNLQIQPVAFSARGCWKLEEHSMATGFPVGKALPRHLRSHLLWQLVSCISLNFSTLSQWVISPRHFYCHLLSFTNMSVQSPKFGCV